jgi:type VI secretion system secreted protein VgrG
MPREDRRSLLTLGGSTLALTRLRGREGIGEHFLYQVEARTDGAPPALASAVGAGAQVTLRDDLGQERIITGVVTSLRVERSDAATAHVRCEIRPAAFALTLGRASRTFQDRSAIEAATSLLERAGVAHRLELTRSYAPRPYRVQRDESDWSFIERTLAAEGVSFTFDHDAASVLVLLDDTRRRAPDLTLPYLPDAGLEETRERLIELGVFGAAGPTAVATRGQSWEKPSLALGASSGEAARYELYQPQARSAPDPTSMEGRVALAGERGAVSGGGAGGVTTSVRLFPGRAFAVDEAPAALSGPWTVTGLDVLHEEAGPSWSIAFSAIAGGVAFRPGQAAAPPAGHVGLSYATVIADGGDEVFPDADGRVRVQMHWDREGAHDARSGTWARVAQRGAPGSMMFPRTGWKVAVVAEEGDGDSPVILARFADGEHPPTYGLPENKTRVVYKTATTPGGGSFNEIHFEDRRGAENLFVHASRDMNVLTLRDGNERVVNDARHQVGRDQAVTTGARLPEQVEQDRTVKVGRDRSIDAAIDRVGTVGGDELRTIGGSRRIHVKGNHNLSAERRELTVGAVQTNVSLGSIDTSTKLGTTLVGGAMLRMTASGSTTRSGLASVEVTGVVKLERAAEQKGLGVDRDLTETIGGNVLQVAKLQLSDGASTTADWTVAGAASGEAEEILIEAAVELELRCGRSFVRLLPEELHVGSTTIALDAAGLELVTGTVGHNG